MPRCFIGNVPTPPHQVQSDTTRVIDVPVYVRSLLCSSVGSSGVTVSVLNKGYPKRNKSRPPCMNACLNDLPNCHVANTQINVLPDRVSGHVSSSRPNAKDTTASGRGRINDLYTRDQNSFNSKLLRNSFNSNSLNSVVGGVNPNDTLDFVHDSEQRRALKRDDLEQGNSFDDVSGFSVGQASRSSLSLHTALTRIDDVHAAARCRSRVHAPGFQAGTSRKKRKLRDISTDLRIANTLFPHDLPNSPSAFGDAACDLVVCIRTSDHRVTRSPNYSSNMLHSAILRGAFEGQDTPT
jgi:hypothetical protein